jgi:thiamine-phosphate pyrophosphorylase
MTESTRRPSLPEGVYGITAHTFSQGRSNADVVRAMIDGGIKIIQYREKRPDKSHSQMLAECREIRDLTRAAGVLFIVNDYVDIALLADADGVHVGQDDLPVADVRRLIGPDKLIGLSTHSLPQAHAAQSAGPDYIGVGPIFSTQTKADASAPVGLHLLQQAIRLSSLPIVAIGGIKQHNAADVVGQGARTICLVTEIVGAKDIAGTVRKLNKIVEVEKEKLKEDS